MCKSHMIVLVRAVEIAFNQMDLSLLIPLFITIHKILNTLKTKTKKASTFNHLSSFLIQASTHQMETSFLIMKILLKQAGLSLMSWEIQQI